MSARIRLVRLRISLELFFGVEAVGRDVLRVSTVLSQQRGHPHHEELVQVGGDNREKLDALEKRMGRVKGLEQHPLVEFEPAELTVDVEMRVGEVWR